MSFAQLCHEHRFDEARQFINAIVQTIPSIFTPVDNPFEAVGRARRIFLQSDPHYDYSEQPIRDILRYGDLSMAKFAFNYAYQICRPYDLEVLIAEGIDSLCANNPNRDVQEWIHHIAGRPQIRFRMPQTISEYLYRDTEYLYRDTDQITTFITRQIANIFVRCRSLNPSIEILRDIHILYPTIDLGFDRDHHHPDFDPETNPFCSVCMRGNLKLAKWFYFTASRLDIHPDIKQIIDNSTLMRIDNPDIREWLFELMDN